MRQHELHHILERIERIMADLSEIQNAADRNTSAVSAAVVTLNDAAARLIAAAALPAPVDPAVVSAIAAQISASADALTQAAATIPAPA